MQTDKPSLARVREVSGISSAYASMILSDETDPKKSRTPPRSLAILIFRETNWRHDSIADLTEEQMRVFEEVDPWVPPKERQEEAA